MLLVNLNDSIFNRLLFLLRSYHIWQYFLKLLCHNFCLFIFYQLLCLFRFILGLLFLIDICNFFLLNLMCCMLDGIQLHFNSNSLSRIKQYCCYCWGNNRSSKFYHLKSLLRIKILFITNKKSYNDIRL